MIIVELCQEKGKTSMICSSWILIKNGAPIIYRVVLLEIEMDMGWIVLSGILYFGMENSKNCDSKTRETQGNILEPTSSRKPSSNIIFSY